VGESGWDELDATDDVWLCLSDECRGGSGARVEDVWMPFVKRRERDAVAVEVPDEGPGAGVRG